MCVPWTTSLTFTVADVMFEKSASALNALSMAQRTFSMISQTSLMDYIS